MPAPLTYKELPPGSDQFSGANPSDAVLKGKWWEVFKDPQLNRYEEMIQVSNQTVKQSEAAFVQSRALINLNRANYAPTISSGPAITSNRTPSTVSNNVTRGGGTLSSFQLPFSVSWEPDFWGRVRLSVENAAANAQASAGDLENVRLLLQAELASDYFALLGIDMERALINDTITAYERYLQLTNNRFQGGVASKADVVLAQAQLDTTRAQATDLGVARSQTEHAIAVLTGHAPSVFSIPTGKIGAPPPEIPTGVPSKLLERRPDIASAERRVLAANANIGIAQTAYYPTLTIGGSAGLEASSLINVFTWPARFWSGSAGISQTLFDNGRRKTQVLISQAAYDQTVATYRQTVLGAFQEVEDNLAALRILAEEQSQLESAVQAAGQSLSLETDRYKAGTVSYLDVITTQTIFLSDQRSSVQVLSRRLTSAVTLIRALGGGWDASQLPTYNDLRTQAAPSTVAQPKP